MSEDELRALNRAPLDRLLGERRQAIADALDVDLVVAGYLLAGLRRAARAPADPVDLELVIRPGELVIRRGR